MTRPCADCGQNPNAQIHSEHFFKWGDPIDSMLARISATGYASEAVEEVEAMLPDILAEGGADERKRIAEVIHILRFSSAQEMRQTILALCGRYERDGNLLGRPEGVV